MNILMTHAARYPWFVITLLGIVTSIALLQLPELKIEISADGIMVNDPQALSLYDTTVETFGSENATMIYLGDEQLLTSDNLAAIQKAAGKIEAIASVSEVTSLFSMRYLRTVEGYIHTTPYFQTIPETSAGILSTARAARLNPLVERNLLSNDGSVMALNVFFDKSERKSGFDEKIANELDLALAPLKQRLQQVFHIGDPSIRTGISEQIRRDQKIILPMAFLVLILTLGIMLKRFTAAMIPLLTATLSVIWILSIMAVLEIPVNIMTSIVPVILIIVGSTEDIHLISEYQSGIAKGLDAIDANHLMSRHMSTAIMLTFVTTCLGFLSITLNQIDLLQQFGLVAAVGLTLNFIITISLVPACLQLTTPQPLTEKHERAYGFYRLALRIFGHISSKPKLYISILMACILYSGYWASSIEINNNVMDYFDSTSELPLQVDLLQQKLSGIHALSVVVSGGKDAFLKLDNLKQLQKIQQYIKSSRLFDKSFSFANYMAVVHSGIDGELSDTPYLPDSDDQISNYMALLGHTNARSFVSSDYSQARIIIRHSINSSNQLNQAIAAIHSFARDSIDSDLTIQVTGESYLNSQAVDYMADGQLRSLLLMLIIIFSIISLMLMDVRIGLVAVLVNLYPISMLFGLMGYLKIPLDTGTIMIAAIALGIGVDHTMHFITRYQRLLNNGLSITDSITQVIRHESLPIYSTALALAMGFATLALSTFPPVALFGLLSALVMLLALLGAFVITPLLLSCKWINSRQSGLVQVVTFKRS
ncbi:hypothetical protein A3194_19255 [Candidatus Thiodiazotropha endoloripes]|uniref:efflux RND transporter permease subunit n=1 Tax=Candidatus Thiodiazotropha endoloripes TaxID=1818881 RepID=UPI00083DDB91|nr:MMPL family transporter [Candidatus Thiodiazotropha endoloripes]ODB82081.1 hypothetical protein A3194_19255 [Candidatus Thiodiazotropha endoloripes]